MLLQKHEIANNTPYEARKYLEDALALTEEMDPPEDLREAVFIKAVDLLSGKQVIVTQMETTANGLVLG